MNKVKRILKSNLTKFNYIFLVLAPVISFFCVELAVANPMKAMYLGKALLNIICYGFIYYFIYAITLQPYITTCIGSVFCLVLGLANAFVLKFRGTPILPFDLISVKTAMNVAGNYSYKLSKHMLYAILLVVIFLVIATSFYIITKKLEDKFSKVLNIEHKKRSIKKAILTRAINFSLFLALLLPSLYIVQRTDFLEKNYIFIFPWNQAGAYQREGFSLSFVANTKFTLIDKPDNYTVENVENLVKDITSDSATQNTSKPNIIAVMNESFSDLQVLKELAVTQDSLPFFRSWTDNTIRGNLLVSVHGGNTCNSEFEFLTGNTMSFLPSGSIPYQQYMKGTQYSLCSTLKDQGYTIESLHPYDANGWNRNNLYPALGFEKSLFLPDFKTRNYIRYYISDKCNYDKVIDEFENRDTDKPYFMFNITMQNHGGYGNKKNNYTYENYIHLKDYEGYKDVDEYLSLIKDSDDALKDFIEYFKTVKEPTIIVFFGDHQPNISSGFYDKIYGKPQTEWSLEELQKKYTVPFVIWANYPIEGKEYNIISPNYLSSILLNAANLPMTAYNKYLLKLSETIPALNVNGYIDNNGKLYSYDEKSPYTQLLNEYKMLQYNNLFDKKNKVSDIFKLK